MSKLSGCLLVLTLALALVGCAGKQTPTFNAKYYPECYDPIEKLCKDQSNEQETRGAVVGAAIGAIGGALIGGLATGRWEGAAAGALAGGVAGGVAGYWKAHLDKIQDQNERLEQYQAMLGEQSKGWDIERATVERAYQCYSEQIDLLKKAYQKKEISREAFIERANEIEAGVNYINTYWADAQHRMDETLVSGEKYLQEQDELTAKASAAEKRRTQAQRRKAQTAQASARKQTQAANERVNALQSRVKDQLQALNDERAGVSGALSWLESGKFGILKPALEGV